MTQRQTQRFGRYLLLHRLAVGGMAEIFLALDPRADKDQQLVVVKRIRDELTSQADFVNMFLDEQRVIDQLHHPNVVRLIDFGDVDGRLFITLEHIWGESLSTLMSLCRDSRVRMPMTASLYIGAQVAAALHHAHMHRDLQGRPAPVFHRDVTMGNVVVSYAGEVKILDFGIAKAKGRLAKTRAGHVKGTLAYLAPEQIRGGDVTAATDIYQLGVLLYNLLVGQPPLVGSNDIELMKAIVTGVIRPISEVTRDFPAPLASLLQRAMALEPQQRFASAGELGAQLRRLIATEYGQGKARLAQLLKRITGDRQQQQRDFIDGLLRGEGVAGRDRGLFQWAFDEEVDFTETLEVTAPQIVAQDLLDRARPAAADELDLWQRHAQDVANEEVELEPTLLHTVSGSTDKNVPDPPENASMAAVIEATLLESDAGPGLPPQVETEDPLAPEPDVHDMPTMLTQGLDEFDVPQPVSGVHELTIRARSEQRTLTEPNSDKRDEVESLDSVLSASDLQESPAAPVLAVQVADDGALERELEDWQQRDEPTVASRPPPPRLQDIGAGSLHDQVTQSPKVPSEGETTDLLPRRRGSRARVLGDLGEATVAEDGVQARGIDFARDTQAETQSFDLHDVQTAPDEEEGTGETDLQRVSAGPSTPFARMIEEAQQGGDLPPGVDAQDWDTVGAAESETEIEEELRVAYRWRHRVVWVLLIASTWVALGWFVYAGAALSLWTRLRVSITGQAAQIAVTDAAPDVAAHRLAIPSTETVDAGGHGRPGPVELRTRKGSFPVLGSRADQAVQNTHAPKPPARVRGVLKISTIDTALIQHRRQRVRDKASFRLKAKKGKISVRAAHLEIELIYEIVGGDITFKVRSQPRLDLVYNGRRVGQTPKATVLGQDFRMQLGRGQLRQPFELRLSFDPL